MHTPSFLPTQKKKSSLGMRLALYRLNCHDNHLNTHVTPSLKLSAYIHTEYDACVISASHCEQVNLNLSNRRIAQSAKYFSHQIFCFYGIPQPLLHRLETPLPLRTYHLSSPLLQRNNTTSNAVSEKFHHWNLQ